MGRVPAARFPWQQEQCYRRACLEPRRRTTRLDKLPGKLGYITCRYFELSDKICDWSALKTPSTDKDHSQCASHDSTRARQLLRKFPQSAVHFIFFSDKKIFTIAAPVNLQNDRIYAAEGVKKRDIPAERLLRIWTRPIFSKSLMVSVAVWKLSCTELIFVEPGAKVDGAYYRDVLLSQSMLAAIHQLARDAYVFQQDSAPAHRARSTVEFLRNEMPDFIPPDLWPPCIVLTWIPLIIKSGAACRRACTRNRFVIWLNSSSELLRSGPSYFEH